MAGRRYASGAIPEGPMKITVSPEEQLAELKRGAHEILPVALVRRQSVAPPA